MSIKKRISTLEGKMTGFDDMPIGIIIQSVSGRKNAIQEATELKKVSCMDVIYNRELEETEDSFVNRVTDAASLNTCPGGVPVLLAI